ncbi:hypothetical protein [Nocardia sp. CA-135398]
MRRQSRPHGSTCPPLDGGVLEFGRCGGTALAPERRALAGDLE